MTVCRKEAGVKLSVCIVTYNQELYIAECLQSLVEQQTSFNFEIIVGDDCSKDKTVEIITAFKNKYPALIKLILHEKNVGAAKNFVSVHSAAIGQYVAHIDGDDYALPGKLQKQVDCMDAYPYCNLTWHRVRVLYQGSDSLIDDLFDFSKMPDKGFVRADILKYITLGMNSSKMYRNGSLNFETPPFPMLDYFANVEQVGEGSAMFVSNEPLGVYRAGIGIASSDVTVKSILHSTFIYFLNKYPQHTQEINQAILMLLIAAFKNLRFDECMLFAGTYLRSFRIRSLINIGTELKFIKTLRLPKV